MGCSKHSLRDRCGGRAEIVGDALALHVLAPRFRLRVRVEGLGGLGLRVQVEGLRGLGVRGLWVWGFGV